MSTQVSKWGNSYALRIPVALARRLKVTEGSKVDLTIEDGALLVRPITSHPDLSELLAGMTEDNIHAETSTGQAVGNES